MSQTKELKNGRTEERKKERTVSEFLGSFSTIPLSFLPNARGGWVG